MFLAGVLKLDAHTPSKEERGDAKERSVILKLVRIGGGMLLALFGEDSLVFDRMGEVGSLSFMCVFEISDDNLGLSGGGVEVGKVRDDGDDGLHGVSGGGGEVEAGVEKEVVIGTVDFIS